MARLVVLLSGIVYLRLQPSSADPNSIFHYEQPPCRMDEVQGEVLGASGYTCSPRCEEGTYNCPGNAPTGTSAQPQCMLQDVNRGAFCGLLCQVDAQCPPSAQCVQLKQAQIGLCLYPLSFVDWVRQASTVKMAVGWPKRPGQGQVAAAQVSKTYAALQNLKTKYSISDGDVDMVTLKELLSSVSKNEVPPSSNLPPLPPVVLTENRGQASPPVVRSGDSNGAEAVWGRDLSRYERELGHGVGGLAEEMQYDLYRAEHITNQYAATELLRAVIFWGLVYLGVGCFIKYQLHGAQGINMIPHISFWLEYPNLVSDGVKFSRLLVENWLGLTPSSSREPDLLGGLDGGIHSYGRTSGAGAFEAI